MSNRGRFTQAGGRMRKGGHKRGRLHKRTGACDLITLLRAYERRRKEFRRNLAEALRLLDFGDSEPAQRLKRRKRKKERGYGKKQWRGKKRTS